MLGLGRRGWEGPGPHEADRAKIPLEDGGIMLLQEVDGTRLPQEVDGIKLPQEVDGTKLPQEVGG